MIIKGQFNGLWCSDPACGGALVDTGVELYVYPARAETKCITCGKKDSRPLLDTEKTPPNNPSIR